MDTLRFITCGSVDDGKSTLIGRLLYETKLVFEDQLEALKADSKKYGTQGEQLDFALLVDGLQAEREQGITIDVAYRFFSTPKRRFIVADTPGHEQYTRNMATGASTAQAAVLLIDARKGVLVQTKRHSRIVSMLGIRHVALAVNKMDLVGFSQLVFDEIELAYRRFAQELGFESITAIPVSALEGHNVVTADRSVMPWYGGPSFLEWLETVPAEAPDKGQPFAMPVQWVNRPDHDFRGFSGRIASGSVKPGDRVRVSPSGVSSRVKEIIVGRGYVCEAGAGQSVTLVLEDEVDASRGDVIAAANHPAEAADQFEADLLWMSEHPLLPGRPYAALIHTKSANVSVTHIKHRLDVNTGARLAAKTLSLNEIAAVNVSFDRAVPFAPYHQNQRLGAFIMIDKLTNETVGAGMIHFALRRAVNVHWQALEVTKAARAEMKRQRPRCLWFTGLSGSGKSTIANLLEKRLHADGKHTYLLDGDNVRHGLNRDLGFTEADRVENIRRVAEVAKLLVDAGLIVIVSFISPYRAERRFARSLFEDGEFIEVFVDTPLEECERRDVKGLYAKARRGELVNFTGIDSAYEPPEAPEVHLKTVGVKPEACVDQILHALGSSHSL
ncbi:MAG TPA: sulfate adenylyltransferase subunit CysN [Methylomirabilota bacterium]|nr:sulfate adenylyltransferase subunit CysN [Methylomirabilota bacterium]